jgi:hypothetical protein
MKFSKLFWLVTVLILLVSLVGCTARGDRVLLKERGADNRCHMKIERSGDPTNLSNREVVDYYGPCDERPDRRSLKPE